MFVLFGRTSGKDCKTLLSEEKPRAWHKSIHIQASWRPATNRENLPSILQKISHPLWHEIRRIAEICHRFWGNPSPILGKSATDFGEIRHRLWEKSATDFRKICHRLWENQPPPGLWSSVFGKNRLRFWEKQAPSLGQSGSVLVKKWLGLGRIGSVFGLAWDKAQVSLFWTLSMLGFGFLRF